MDRVLLVMMPCQLDIVVADRFFPSSKLCSGCGVKNEALTLSERSWLCPNCNTQHDRDVNAAIDLEFMAVSSTVTACGAESAGALVSTGV